MPAVLRPFAIAILGVAGVRVGGRTGVVIRGQPIDSALQAFQALEQFDQQGVHLADFPGELLGSMVGETRRLLDPEEPFLQDLVRARLNGRRPRRVWIMRGLSAVGVHGQP